MCSFSFKVEIFGQVSWNRDIGIKCWNCQIRPEKNWNCRHAAAPRPGSFNFFRPNWQFQHFSQITVSWNYPKIQLWHWNCHKKLSFLLSVSSETDDKKKRTRFPLKTQKKFYHNVTFLTPNFISIKSLFLHQNLSP